MTRKLTAAQRDRLCIAVHECGHAVVTVLAGGSPLATELLDDADARHDIAGLCHSRGVTEHCEPEVTYAGAVALARFLRGPRPSPADLRALLAANRRHRRRAVPVSADKQRKASKPPASVQVTRGSYRRHGSAVGGSGPEPPRIWYDHQFCRHFPVSPRAGSGRTAADCHGCVFAGGGHARISANPAELGLSRRVGLRSRNPVLLAARVAPGAGVIVPTIALTRLRWNLAHRHREKACWPSTAASIDVIA